MRLPLILALALAGCATRYVAHCRVTVDIERVNGTEAATAACREKFGNTLRDHQGKPMGEFAQVYGCHGTVDGRPTIITDGSDLNVAHEARHLFDRNCGHPKEQFSLEGGK